jgi:methylthioribose-1-phosphate isomerase
MRTIDFLDGKVVAVDQTLIPREFKTVELSTVDEICGAIRRLAIRGAPAIGVAGAFGIIVGAANLPTKTTEEVFTHIEGLRRKLIGVRPTAINLKWAVDSIVEYAYSIKDLKYDAFLEKLTLRARRMADDEVRRAESLSAFGATLVPESGARILTHCSTGPLCTVDYGLGMGAVYTAMKQGKKVHVFTDETRPRLQGAKINTFDLKRMGIPFTLITDDSAAFVMKREKVDMLFISADRVAANGDTAAKIGVYGLSIAAREHGIPVYVFCPMSTIDYSTMRGDDIEIEERDAEEVLSINGDYIAPRDTPVLNYAFDITPARYINAIITDLGIVKPPFEANLAGLRKTFEEALENGAR